MPRPKVLESQRRRIAKACLPCQASKQKCDGQSPCRPCSARGRHLTCAYSTHERSYGQRRTRRPRKGLPRGEATEEISQTDAASAGPLPPSSSPSRTLGDDDTPLTHSATTQPSNTRGKTRTYVGEGGTISTLRHLGALVDIYDEVSAAALEGYESNESIPIPANQSEGPEGLEPDKHNLLELIDVFLIVTRGELDIVDRSDLESLTYQYFEGSLRDDHPDAAFYSLVLACAAILRSHSSVDLSFAENFFERGNRIAHARMRYEPTLQSAKFFLLVYIYLLARCQKNAAFFNLGIAISAAKTIGIHRYEFDSDSPHTRWGARVWTTLRYHDLYFCSMNGRTPSSITTDAYVWPKSLPTLRTIDKNEAQQQDDMLRSTYAFCFIEQCLLHGPETLGLDNLRQLARQLREAIPPVPADSVRHNANSRIDIMGRAVVACNYYFSMMVLTRPLLIACVRGKQKYSSSANTQSDVIPILSAENLAASMASIDAAIYTTRTVHQLMVAQVLYRNMSWVIGWVFLAALVLCLAHLGQLGSDWEVVHGINQAEEILAFFYKTSKQADQYRRIISRVSEAVNQALHKIAEEERTSHSLSLPNLVGDHFIDQVGSGTRNSRQTSRPHSPEHQHNGPHASLGQESGDGARGFDNSMDGTFAPLDDTDWSCLDWAMDDVFNLTAFFDDPGTT